MVGLGDGFELAALFGFVTCEPEAVFVDEIAGDLGGGDVAGEFVESFHVAAVIVCGLE